MRQHAHALQKTPRHRHMERNIFSFSSKAVPNTLFHVAFFSGIEGLNKLFNFHITLLHSDTTLDPGRLLSAPCRFEILREGGEAAVFSGYLDSVEQKGRYGDFITCEVHLRPAFAKLERIVQSTIFLNKTVEEVLRDLLHSQQFFSFPYEFNILQTDYPRQEFSMQYQESIYEYASWRMEEQGIYFYFEEINGRDTVIFSDDPHAHKTGEDLLLQYRPVSGMEGNHFEEVIHNFSLQQQSQPRQVVIRSCSWHNPNAVILGKATVDPAGIGDVYLTNEYVETSEQAKRLARIRAQELQCRARIFHGASSVPLLRPGRVFRLAGHYCEAFNKNYLVTEIHHEGRQDAYLHLKLGLPAQPGDEQLYYRNSFTCQEAERPFRPARTARRTSIPGVLHAFVAGEGSGKTAYMDEFGRYKLYFPFDVSGRSGGNCSCWIRRALPQVGKNSGLALPLQPGSEVLVTFENGNPDLPVITGALANAETGSVSSMSNPHMQGLRSAGGNSISINNADTKQGLSLHSAGGGTLGFQSGSLEIGYLNSANWLQFADMAMTHISGIASSIRSFKSASLTTTTLKQQKCAIASAILQAVAQCCDIGTDINNQTGLASASGGLKALAMLLSANTEPSIQLLNLISKNSDTDNTTYRTTISAGPDKSGLEANIFQSRNEQLGIILASLITKTASISLQSKNADDTRKEMDAKSKEADATIAKYNEDTSQSDSSKTDSDKQQATLSDLDKDTVKLLTSLAEEDKKYANIAKVTSVCQPVITGVSELLPEILACILLFSEKKTADNYHGILLDARQSNINMVARDAISQHAARGHLRNTLELGGLLTVAPEASNKAIGEKKGSDSTSTTNINILKPYNENVINLGTYLPNNSDHATDFMAQDDPVFEKAYWYNKKQVNNYININFEQDINLRKKDTFIADTTHLHTMRNDKAYLYSKHQAHIRGGYALELSAGDITESSKKTGRILLLGQGQASVPKNINPPPVFNYNFPPHGVTILSSNSSILLESRSKNEHNIYQNNTSKSGNNDVAPLSGALLGTKEFQLYCKNVANVEDVTAIQGQDKKLTLTVSNGGTKATVELTDESITLSAAGATLTISGGNITLKAAERNSIDIGCIKFDNSKISCNNGILQLQNGAIKIVSNSRKKQ